jgi:RAD50-interacting protein 1
LSSPDLLLPTHSRWDPPTPEGGEDLDRSLTTELIAPLSLFSSLLKTLVASYPHSVATTLYRRIAVSLSTSLYDRLLVNRTWSESGAHQLNYDIEQGFLQAGREAGIRRGVSRGWDKLIGGAKIMALPATSGSGGFGDEAVDEDGEAKLTFSRVMQLAFDDSVPEGEGTQFNVAMEQLGVGEVLGKVEVQQVMRRRPECWR